MQSKKTWSEIVGKMVVAMIVAPLVMWVPFWLLWNYLQPVFHWPPLTFWQAAATVALLGFIPRGKS